LPLGVWCGGARQWCRRRGLRMLRLRCLALCARRPSRCRRAVLAVLLARIGSRPVQRVERGASLRGRAAGLRARSASRCGEGRAGGAFCRGRGGGAGWCPLRYSPTKKFWS